jgi:hypothetical protein
VRNWYSKAELEHFMILQSPVLAKLSRNWDAIAAIFMVNTGWLGERRAARIKNSGTNPRD